MNDVIEKFDMLCDVAMAAYGEELDISHEQSLLNILNFVKKYPGYKEEFSDRFKSILVSDNSPFEAVAFCMRELQWPEIKDFVILEMNPSEDPRTEALRSTLTAYDEFWPDTDLYSWRPQKLSATPLPQVRCGDVLYRTQYRRTRIYSNRAIPELQPARNCPSPGA